MNGSLKTLQKRLVQELKEICQKRHIQIICTTHSPTILRALPPEGRIHLEKHGGKVTVYPGISPDYAATMLSESKQVECEILVEDVVSAEIVSLAATAEGRSRTRICPVGSSEAVIRGLASHFKMQRESEICAFLDGDKQTDRTEIQKSFLSALETVTDKAKTLAWLEKRVGFLPGKLWPEEWVLSKDVGSVFKDLPAEFGVTANVLSDYMTKARLAGKHNEFHELGNHIGLSPEIIRPRFIKCAVQNSEAEIAPVRKLISDILAG